MHISDKFRAFTTKEILLEIFLKFLKMISVNLFFKNDFLSFKKNVNRFISKGYNVLRVNDRTLLLKLNNEMYFLRRYGSDIKVFEQIVVNEEYNYLIKLIDMCGLGNTPLTILDCGSNIGLFTVWIMNKANVNKIVSIEADPENYIFQKFFIEKRQYDSRVELVNKAIWSDSVSRLRISSDFRDGDQWAKCVVPTYVTCHNSVDSISLNQVFDEYLDRKIHILKIDIEGAEKVIFEKNESFDRLLNKTMIVAIEIHEEVDCTTMILSILKSYGFELNRIGETTFGFKNIN